jgi:hypothetical protein
MKKWFIVGAIVIVIIIVIGLINRENAKINREAIENLPPSSTESNRPQTFEEAGIERP